MRRPSRRARTASRRSPAGCRKDGRGGTRERPAFTPPRPPGKSPAERSVSRRAAASAAARPPCFCTRRAATSTSRYGSRSPRRGRTRPAPVSSSTRPAPTWGSSAAGKRSPEPSAPRVSAPTPSPWPGGAGAAPRRSWGPMPRRASPPVEDPVRLKLSRRGDRFTVAWSPDGTAWTPLPDETLPGAPETLWAGLLFEHEPEDGFLAGEWGSRSELGDLRLTTGR